MLSTAKKKAEPSLTLNRESLHAYQERIVEHIKKHAGCACLVDMGLGKTTSTLTALQDLSDVFEINKTLVIAPLRVARSTWPSEVDNWQHITLDYAVVCGSERERVEALQKDVDLYFINRENVVWLVEKLGKKWPFDVVVIDESTSFKNNSSKRFKALKRVRKFIERTILLTGTPAPNGLLDLWSQLFLVDGGERLGKTFTAYKQRYFTSDYMGYNWTPREGSEDKIYNKIADVCLTMQAKDYLELPDRIDNRIEAPLNIRQLAKYRELERELLIELEGEEITALSAAALSNKLLQMANGAVYNADGDFVTLHNAKLDALNEIIETNEGKPVLIAYNYRSDLERIKAKFPKAVQLDKDPATIDKWNRGEIPLLLAHPASAGHGLNLQRGGSVAVWFGLNWSLELYQQFNARLHRQGQKETVIIHHVIAPGTIDDVVIQALTNKHDVQQALIDYLKNQ